MKKVTLKIKKEQLRQKLDIRDGKDGSPDSAQQVRDKLESLEGDERLDKSAVKGLEEELEKLKKKPVAVGITGRDLFGDIDLSSQLDGVTTTFNIHAVWSIISVDLSSFPHALRKNIDYTYTPTTITFTNQIDPATSLAAGQTCILTVVKG